MTSQVNHRYIKHWYVRDTYSVRTVHFYNDLSENNHFLKQSKATVSISWYMLGILYIGGITKPFAGTSKLLVPHCEHRTKTCACGALTVAYIP